MTVETKYYFGPKDLTGISLTCSHCKSVITVVLHDGREKPEEAAYRCGVCRQEWLNGKSGLLSAFAGLVKGLKEFAREDNNGFTLAFQIDKAKSELT